LSRSERLALHADELDGMKYFLTVLGQPGNVPGRIVNAYIKIKFGVVPAPAVKTKRLRNASRVREVEVEQRFLRAAYDLLWWPSLEMKFTLVSV
jgi:hypothetical protein